MKRILFSLVLLFAFNSVVLAHLQPPITSYVQFSKDVFIAKATAINNRVVTFAVSEIIKGNPPTALVLGSAEAPVAITLNSEWLLASTGDKSNTVGWALKGDQGWVNAPIQRVDGKIHLVGKYGFPDKDLASDPSKGLTLEQLKELAKTPIPNH